MTLPDLDISTAVQAAFIFSILGVIVTFLMGVLSLGTQADLLPQANGAD
jgi:MFS superfamily sulfate permease-like transporter